MTWFKGQAADFYDSGIQKLVPRLKKCLDFMCVIPVVCVTNKEGGAVKQHN